MKIGLAEHSSEMARRRNGGLQQRRRCKPVRFARRWFPRRRELPTLADRRCRLLHLLTWESNHGWAARQEYEGQCGRRSTGETTAVSANRGFKPLRSSMQPLVHREYVFLPSSTGAHTFYT